MTENSKKSNNLSEEAHKMKKGNEKERKEAAQSMGHAGGSKNSSKTTNK